MPRFSLRTLILLMLLWGPLLAAAAGTGRCYDLSVKFFEVAGPLPIIWLVSVIVVLTGYAICGQFDNLEQRVSIRLFLTRKLFVTMLLGLACFVAVASIFVSGERHLAPYAAFPFAGFAAVALYVHFFIRCPRCDFPLGRHGGSFTAFSLWPTNYCPGCGIHLDDDVEGTSYPSKPKKDV